METVLKIYGDIGTSNEMALMMGMEECISAKDVSDFLDENKKAKEITVKINSRGGDVTEGWTIYDLLANSGKKIKTIGEGKVYSIATVIFLAGEEREMMQNADGQIHNPYIPEYTLADSYEAGDLEKIAESLRQEEQKILDFYVEKTGSEESVLADYMSKDTKLSAEDMVTLGFATKVIEPVKAYAYIKPIKKEFVMTEKDVKTFGEKIDSILDKIKNLSRIEPANMTLTDKDGNEFTLEKEEGSPAEGDKATPDGTFVMADGKTIVITDGAIASITEEENHDELAEAKAKITKLEAEIETLKGEKPDLVKAEADLKVKTDEATEIVTQLKALKNDWKPEGRTKISSAEKAGSVDLARVKEIMKNKTKTE